jgi:hypothetical protein
MLYGLFPESLKRSAARTSRCAGNPRCGQKSGSPVTEIRTYLLEIIAADARAVNLILQGWQSPNWCLAMRLGRHDIGALVWLGTCACLLFGFFGFAIVAPWTFDVMSTSEAALRCPGAIDTAWPAVWCNHGRPVKWELGLISDRPLRYSLALLQMIAGLAAFFFGVRQMKRFR